MNEESKTPSLETSRIVVVTGAAIVNAMLDRPGGTPQFRYRQGPPRGMELVGLPTFEMELNPPARYPVCFPLHAQTYVGTVDQVVEEFRRNLIKTAEVALGLNDREMTQYEREVDPRVQLRLDTMLPDRSKVHLVPVLKAHNGQSDPVTASQPTGG